MMFFFPSVRNNHTRNAHEKKIMSCLFRSLGYHVNADPNTTRQRICDYMEKDPLVSGEPISYWIWAQKAPNKAADYQDTDVHTNYLKPYINSMRKPSEWGSAIEIAAFCHMYDARVIVQNIRSNDMKGMSTLGVPMQKNRLLRIEFVPTKQPNQRKEEKHTDNSETGIKGATGTSSSSSSASPSSYSAEVHVSEVSKTSSASASASSSTLPTWEITWSGGHYEPVR